MKKISPLAMTAAATMLLGACAGMGDQHKGASMNKAAMADASGQCSGINSCNGTSECATATSSCKGQNSCKGQGWVTRTKADCESAGGTFKSA